MSSRASATSSKNNTPKKGQASPSKSVKSPGKVSSKTSTPSKIKKSEKATIVENE